MTNHIENYFSNIILSSKNIDYNKIEKLAYQLSNLRKKNGRLFIIGVGGSAGNASHAVNDFRKLCKIETYSPIDNVSELTARINDEGWDSSISEWLKISKLNNKDAILIFSVGGGNIKKRVSINIVNAIKFAKLKKSKIFSIIGKKNGYAAKNSNVSILIESQDQKLITPISESFQSVVWHCLVSHPLLQANKTKW